ncbi:MAG: hypothetical protein AAF267_23015 [Deinococcota bacterium]
MNAADPRPDLINDTQHWRAVLEYCYYNGLDELLTILKSLRYRGATINGTNILKLNWQDIDYEVISHDELKNEYLLPNWQAIKAALEYAQDATRTEAVAA